MSKLNDYFYRLQVDSGNQGWRIKWISSGHGGISVFNSGGGKLVGSIILCGTVMLVAAFLYAIMTASNSKDLALPACVFLVGASFVSIGAIVNEKRRKSDWLRIEASCVDREIRRVRNGRGRHWAIRIKCVYVLNEEQIVCTPRVRWFGSGDQKGTEFLEKKINSHGECQIRVNPDNPLEADLL